MKKLIIQASNSYDGDPQVVPINSLDPIIITSEFGTFKLMISIKDFDGTKAHKHNSLPNIKGLDELLPSLATGPPNLCFDIQFIPNTDIGGDELLFGNDCRYPIREHVPITSLMAGLKLFNFFINNTLRGNLYHDKPFLYGPIVGAATYLSRDQHSQFPNEISVIDTSKNSITENLLPDYPVSKQRKKFFNKLLKCHEFTFKKSNAYHIKVDSNFISMSNSKYSINLPTFSSGRYVVDVGRHINDHFNNFNWVIKLNGQGAVDDGIIGLVVNFKVVDE